MKKDTVVPIVAVLVILLSGVIAHKVVRFELYIIIMSFFLGLCIDFMTFLLMFVLMIFLYYGNQKKYETVDDDPKYRLKRIGFAAISFGIICAGALIW